MEQNSGSRNVRFAGQANEIVETGEGGRGQTRILFGWRMARLATPLLCKIGMPSDRPTELGRAEVGCIRALSDLKQNKFMFVGSHLEGSVPEHVSFPASPCYLQDVPKAAEHLRQEANHSEWRTATFQHCDHATQTSSCRHYRVWSSRVLHSL